MSLRIVEDILADILYISITRACKVFMMDLMLSFYNSSLNDEFLSPYMIFKALSSNAFIILPRFLLRNLHTGRQ